MAGDGTTGDTPWTAPTSDADQQWAPDSQPAGQWLADPWYRYEYRYQHADGTWSDNVASGGVQGVDRPVDGSMSPTGVVPVVAGVAGVPGRRRRLVPLLLAVCAVIVIVGAILVATNDSGGKKTVKLSPAAASPTTTSGTGDFSTGSGGSSPSTGPNSSTTTVAGGNTATGSTTTSTTAATTTTTVAGTAAPAATTPTTSAPAATTPTTAAPQQSGDFQLVSFSPTDRGAAFSGSATIRNTGAQTHGAEVRITLFRSGNLVATLNGATQSGPVAPGQSEVISLTSSDRVQPWDSYVFAVPAES